LIALALGEGLNELLEGFPLVREEAARRVDRREYHLVDVCLALARLDFPKRLRALFGSSLQRREFSGRDLHFRALKLVLVTLLVLVVAAVPAVVVSIIGAAAAFVVAAVLIVIIVLAGRNDF